MGCTFYVRHDSDFFVEKKNVQKFLEFFEDEDEDDYVFTFDSDGNIITLDIEIENWYGQLPRR